MNKYLKNNQGYTLVIVLVVLVLFTVIGAGLMTLNFNNTIKNASREDNTQAQDLSIKGIDYVINDIELKMANKLEHGLTPAQFETEFTALLNSYLCKPNLNENTSLTNTETGDAVYCIEKYEPAKPLSKTLLNVTFKSVGVVESKEHITKATYTLGTDVDNSIDYALLTYGSEDLNIDPTIANNRGNIDLHGGLTVNGNIFADKSLYTSDSSNFKGRKVESIFPIIKGADNTAYVEVRTLSTNQRDAQLNPTTSESYTLNSKSQYNPKDASSTLDVNFNIPAKLQNAKNFFNSGVELIDTKVEVDFKEKNNSIIYDIPTNKKYYYKNGLAIDYIDYFNANGSNLNNLSKNKVQFKANQTSLLVDAPFIKPVNRTNINWIVNGKNNVNHAIFPKDLSLKYGVKLPPTIDFFDASTNPDFVSKGITYIGGNFSIGLDHKDELNFDLFGNITKIDALGLLGGLESISNIETPVHLSGTYYVEGDLQIVSGKLTGDATFFVGGKTSILFSELGVDSPNSTFNIISNKEIRIAYVGNNHNDYLSKVKEPSNSLLPDLTLELRKLADPLKTLRNDHHRSVFNGHLHSNEKVILDAATSYLTINGSISAPEIYATSIKGRAEASCENIGNYLSKALTPVTDGVFKLLGFILNILTFGTVEDFINNTLNSLIGTNANDNQMKTYYSSNGALHGSNCFLKKDLQELDEVPYSNYLVKLLNLEVGQISNDPITLESRLIINYSPTPLANLQAKFGEEFIKHEKILEMDPPQQISRE